MFSARLEEEDLPTLRGWGGAPELGAMLGGWLFPGLMRQTRQWCEGLASDPRNQPFAIELLGSGLVGTANLVDIDWKIRQAFHGMMIGEPSMRRKGPGVDVVMGIMRYTFDEMGLHRLNAWIIDFNAASAALYCGKCGWKVEGRQRGWYCDAKPYWPT